MTLTDLINRLAEATIDLDQSSASNTVRKLVDEFREFDRSDESYFGVIKPAPRTQSGF